MKYLASIRTAKASGSGFISPHRLRRSRTMQKNKWKFKRQQPKKDIHQIAMEREGKPFEGDVNEPHCPICKQPLDESHLINIIPYPEDAGYLMMYVHAECQAAINIFKYFDASRNVDYKMVDVTGDV